MVCFIYPSRFQGHLSYFHSIVAKLCSTDHQSCQEPETLSVGHFFQKKLLNLCEMSSMVFSLFEYLDSVNAITDSMFNFGNFLTKNAITFDQKEIERKILYLVRMKFRCASNAAIKNIKIARKKINFFSKIFSTKSPFFKKNTDF